MGRILYVLATGALTFATTIYGGWVFRTLWGWYAVPEGLRPIGMQTAIGAMLLLSFAGFGPSVLLSVAGANDDKKKPSETLTIVFLYLTLYTVSLASGWFYQMIF